MSGSDTIRVEVVYATPHEQALVTLQLSVGSTLETAIRRSGLLQRFPEIDLARDGVGIFGKRMPMHQVLLDRDRVELYRALIADPKDVRRQRAAAGKLKPKS